MMNTPVDFIIFFGVIFGLLSSAYIFLKWFPSTWEFRISEKTKGTYTYYRSEVKRPIFGWTPFMAFRSTGDIMTDWSWDISKSDCQHQIDLYKKLKPTNPLS